MNYIYPVCVELHTKYNKDSKNLGWVSIVAERCDVELSDVRILFYFIVIYF
jgi:hypothetical protein